MNSPPSILMDFLIHCLGSTYRPERPKGAKDEVMRPFLPFLPILPILHCRGAKPAAAKPEVAKPTASKADYGRPRQTKQTKADCSRPKQTMADQSILKSAVLRASPMPLLLSNLCCPDMFAKYHVASSQAHFILTKIF